MKPIQRISLALAVAALAATATACGTTEGPEAIDDPRPSTTTTSRPTADPPGDDEIVWQEFTRGGFVPSEFAAGQVPAVTIYADGRVILTSDDADLGADRPAGLEEAQIAEGDLDRFLAEAADSGLFEPDADFGDPMVTDQPSTSVTLRSGDAPRTVDVYALDFELDPSVGGVTADQSARRDRLKALLEQARDLAIDPQPYVPERVRATLITYASDVGSEPEAIDWPGPPLSAFPDPQSDGANSTCLVVEGPDAAAVSAAAAENPDRTWAIDGEVRQIVVAPLVPGQEGCPPG